DFVGLPWFCERDDHPSTETNAGRNKNILVTGGGTSSLTKQLVQIALELQHREDARIFVDSLLYASMHDKSAVEKFAFTADAFRALDWIVCRPGLGILTDAVKYKIAVCVLKE